MATNVSQQVPVYDVTILHADVDENLALSFGDVIKKHDLQDGRQPKVFFQHVPGMSVVKLIDHGARASRFIFVLLTDNFEKDGLAERSKDECIVHSFEDPIKSNCVIPIFTKPKHQLRIPAGLKSIRGIDISNILKGPPLNMMPQVRVQDWPYSAFEETCMEKLKTTLDRAPFTLMDLIHQQTVQPTAGPTQSTIPAMWQTNVPPSAMMAGHPQLQHPVPKADPIRCQATQAGPAQVSYHISQANNVIIGEQGQIARPVAHQPAPQPFHLDGTAEMDGTCEDFVIEEKGT